MSDQYDRPIVAAETFSRAFSEEDAAKIARMLRDAQEHARTTALNAACIAVHAAIDRYDIDIADEACAAIEALRSRQPPPIPHK